MYSSIGSGCASASSTPSVASSLTLVQPMTTAMLARKALLTPAEVKADLAHLPKAVPLAQVQTRQPHGEQQEHRGVEGVDECVRLEDRALQHPVDVDGGGRQAYGHVGQAPGDGGRPAPTDQYLPRHRSCAPPEKISGGKLRAIWAHDSYGHVSVLVVHGVSHSIPTEGIADLLTIDTLVLPRH